VATDEIAARRTSSSTEPCARKREREGITSRNLRGLTTLDVEPNNSIVLEGDMAETVATLKENDGMESVTP
jgi:hypothetical protein